MISFVIPVYKPNYQIFGKCLKSLKEQSLKDWEAVVVFDGLDEQAEAMVHGIGDKRFRILKQDNQGVQKARNNGAKEAKGDILSFWDCDCIIEPDTAKMWVDTFKERNDIDFIYSGYKFLDEQGGIPSEEFDPYTLKCGNYISTMFPMRRSVFPGFDESLKSLQDWDLWLTIVERGGRGYFVPGYAFSTAYPTPESISGKGCTNDIWLERVDAVKSKHNLPDRKVCVCSFDYKEEGIRLAKAIEADYKDVPNYKPNRYDCVIQVGFSLVPNKIRQHTAVFTQKLKKKIIFWTAENVWEINNFISHKALKMYSTVLNAQSIQFVEDMAAKKIMESAGFVVRVLPMPMVNAGKIEALPEKPRILADISDEYRQIVTCLVHSLPDIPMDFVDRAKPIKEYSMLLSLNSEKTMNFPLKRMILAGRNVVSNVQSPFCGYVNDDHAVGKYVSELVGAIRNKASADNKSATKYWKKECEPKKLLEAINE